MGFNSAFKGLTYVTAWGTLSSGASNTVLCFGALFAELPLGLVSEIDDPNAKINSDALATRSPELTIHV